MATNENPTAPPLNVTPVRLLHARMVQNFHVVWLDGNIDEVNDDECRNSISKLQQVVHVVNTFTDADECIAFIDSIKDTSAFVISSGALGQTIIPMLHDKEQVNTIYIFCNSKIPHEEWVKEWSKVAGVYTDIKPICEVLKKATQHCDRNSDSISLVQNTDTTVNKTLDTLDCSFMYTQILKEVLLTINFDQEHINDFFSYCREQFVGNKIELKRVEELRREYRHQPPIWWYAGSSFLYSILNRSLRLMEVNVIVKIGFFIYDLHNHIATLHSEQYGGHRHSDSFTVYRGQGLSSTHFDQLKATQGGLLAFNNFLSTSLVHTVALAFACDSITSTLVGVVFVMKIDPSISSTPFANVKNIAGFEEEEILFSMHSVFRIGEVKQIQEKNHPLWQVELTLTSDNDPQLHNLTESMREETLSTPQGWYRLGLLLIKLHEFDNAEELCETLLKQTTNGSEQGYLYHLLGWIKDSQGKYTEALGYYEKSIAINQKILPPAHPNFAATYNSIGLLYYGLDEHSKALLYYDKVLAIDQKRLPANHPALATTYNNIGLVHRWNRYRRPAGRR